MTTFATMTDAELVECARRTSPGSTYRALAAGSEPVESSLRVSLVEHIAAEICLGTMPTLAAARAWVRATFLATRMAANPRRYGLAPGVSLLGVHAALDGLLADALHALVRAQCLRIERGGGEGGAGGSAGAPPRGEWVRPAAADLVAACRALENR